MQRFELVIEAEQALSFIELREIVSIIDDHILEEISEGFFLRPPRYPDYAYESFASPSEFSFVQIEFARSGSIVLGIVLGGIAVWGWRALALGARRSRLGRELSRFGENAGNVVANGLAVINDRLEDWSNNNERIRDRKTKVRLRKISRED